MPIDDLLGDLQQDTLAVIDTELRRIEAEILRRRIVSIRFSATMLSTIDELESKIARLNRINDWEPDVNALERSNLERERRDKHVRLAEEEIQRWQDLQPLYLQQRQVLKERQEETQDYDWSTYDS